MKTRAYDWLDTKTNTPWYWILVYAHDQWMSLYNKEKGTPVLFRTEEERELKRKGLRKLPAIKRGEG